MDDLESPPKLERPVPLDQVFTRCFRGGKFHPFAPRVDEVSILDIAHSLALKCRFNGHTPSMYSVAQHSVLVARQIINWDGRWALKGLLHDAAEAYLVDLPTPIKKHVQFRNEWIALETRIDEAIHTAFGIAFFAGTRYIKDIDRRMLVTEQRDLMVYDQLGEGGCYDGVEPFDFTIEPWTSERAEEEFLMDFKKYMGQRCRS